MQDRTNQPPNPDNVATDFPKPQAVQLQEGTLLLMEDALEERSQKNRRVTDKKLNASEERRKNIRRKEDKPDSD